MAHRPTKKELENILKKYAEGKATPEETSFLEQYYDYLEDRPGLSALLTEEENSKTEQKNWEHLNAQIEEPSHVIIPHRVPLYARWRSIAAASIILAIGVSSWYLLNSKNDQQQQVVEKNTRN